MAEIWVPSYVREFAGWALIIWFALLLTWPGSRD
jgi:hypothetical protein